MSLRTSYTLLAPIYDRMVAAATQAARRASLARLPADARQVLLVGAGTGLDFPLLPAGPQYTAIDLTPAMLDRARPRAAARPELAIELRSGDALALDFADASFDAVILHLIVAVVPGSPNTSSRTRLGLNGTISSAAPPGVAVSSCDPNAPCRR